MTTETAQHSLSTSTARMLATTTKTAPQMLGISPRYLLRALPWVDLEAGVYRVNRRRGFILGDGLISTYSEGVTTRVIAGDLYELPFLRGLDPALLTALADGFVQREVESGAVIAEADTPADRLHVIALGRAEKRATGQYGEDAVLDMLGDGDFFDEAAWVRGEPMPYQVRATTPCTVLSLDRQLLNELAAREPALLAALDAYTAGSAEHRTADREHPIGLAAGHAGEPDLPQTFVDYEDTPREYELSVAQTVLRVHTRVSDLYNSSIDQVQAQLRLTKEALRERQEWEMLNHPDFGLLNCVAPGQRVHTRTGAPTPDDLDELLTRVWKQPAFFLAHPKAIAAFGRECTRRGVPPVIMEIFGSPFMSWRGVPLLPSDKLDLKGSAQSAPGTTNILLMRVGEAEQGVVGLRPASVPDEVEPGLSVRPMGVDLKAITSYLVTSYFSAAALVDDAIAVLQNVEVSKFYDYS